MRLSKKQKQISLSVIFGLICAVANQNCAPYVPLKSDSYSEASLGGVASLKEFDAFGETGLRRLTRSEVVNSLTDIFSVTPDSTQVELLPLDGGGVNLFENDYKAQGIDTITVMNYESFAQSYAVNAAAATSMVSKVAGCQPQNSSDEACFQKLVKKAGRRLLRRAIPDTEAATYVTKLMPYAKSENRFNTAVELLLSSFIMNPEFLYRVEREVNALNNNTIFQLNDFEIASRISYFIQGSGPDEVLLDLAEAGQLHDANQRAIQAERLLGTARARKQFNAFHAQWLGYADQYFPDATKADLFAESNALFEKVVFDQKSNWMDIFTFDQTYITPQLAQLYGMPAITRASWQPYPAGRGGGVLSHGTFATMGAKFGDTSPSLRGYNIYKKLLCGKLGPVPPGVDVNNAPGTPGDCKDKRYSMRQVSACASCHQIIDGLGFGMERVGAFGEWRTVETNLTQCSISGNGNWENRSFNGPRELGEVLHSDPRVAQCASQQLFRFMSGRLENSDDSSTIQALGSELSQSKTLTKLVIELVKTPAIMYHQPGRL